jgi:hypothetical protein
MNKKISAIEMCKGNAFVSYSNVVKAYKKKGNNYYTHDTGMSEDIKSLHIHGNHMWTSGEYVMYHYQDKKELDYFMCPGLFI